MPYEFTKPSVKSTVFLDHVDAMEATSQMEVGDAFKLPRNKYALNMLRDLANSLSTGKKCFVVVSYDDYYEVQRLPNGSNARLFYKYLGASLDEPDYEANAQADYDKSLAELKLMINRYLDTDVEENKKYDANVCEEMKLVGMITHSYLQRRTAPLASYRKSEEGATERLKRCIKTMIEKGALRQVDNTSVALIFRTFAKVYEINKEALDKLN